MKKNINEITEQQKLWLMYKMGGIEPAYGMGTARDFLRDVMFRCSEMGIPREYFDELSKFVMGDKHPIGMGVITAKQKATRFVAQSDYPLSEDIKGTEGY